MKTSILFRSCLLVAFLTFASPAWLSAATLSQTLNFDSSDFSEPTSATTSYSPVFSGTINLFDPSLGTLDDITVDFSFTFSSVTNSSGGSVSMSGSGSVFWNDTGIAGSGNGAGTGGPPGTYPLTMTISLTNFAVTNITLAEAQGIGTTNLSFDTSLTISTNSSIQLDSGTLSLTYNYTAVPEPGVWGVALAGLLVGAATHRRRKISKFRVGKARADNPPSSSQPPSL